jgi:alpha-ribazole phosphatase
VLAASRHCSVEILEALRELHFGDFEGRTYDEIAQLYPETYARWMEHPTETELPGGETFAAMWLRVTETCRELRRRHAGRSIACVTHGGVIRIVIAEALGVPPGRIFSISQAHGGINLVRYRDGVAAVELMNAGSAFQPWRSSR